MKPKYKILLLSLLLLFSSNARDVNFKHLTVDNGLSQISVMSIFVDEKGFIWMGTRDGLNYFDGNEIISFKPEKGSANTSVGTNIIQITGNKKGDIYILCTEGVSKYNYISESFSTLFINKDIKSIYYNDGLFIAERNRILKYDEEKEEFTVFYAMSNLNINITSFLIDGDDIWMGTSDTGVFLSRKNELSHVISTGEVTSIYQDADNDIWIGTWQHGCYVIGDDNVVNYRTRTNDSTAIASNFVRAFTEDDNGHIWVGTFNGLSRFDKLTQHFTTYNTRGEIGGLTDLSIWSLVTDLQGTVWVGTYYGGVNYFNPRYEIYSLIRASTIEKKGLSYPVVGKIIEDRRENLWICTEGGGLTFYDRKADRFKWYSATKKTADLSQDNVKAFYFDEKRQVIWLGLHLGGLNKVDLKSGQVFHYQHHPDDPTTIPSSVVLDILPYKDKLLIGTNNGVSLFSPSTGKSQKLFTNLQSSEMKFVRDMLLDDRGRLWLAVMNEGVYTYDFETNSLKKYDYQVGKSNSLLSNKIYSIYLDSKNRIWIATASGINVLHLADERIESYDAQDGLLHEGVYATRELRPDEMLLLTNQGVAKFDVAKKRFSNLNIINSFPVKSLNEGALCITSDSKIYIGTVEGLLTFNEQDLNFGSLPYQIQFTKLWVNGDKVEINDERDILQQSLAYSSSLKLKSQYHTFTVEFATSNFVTENISHIVYRLNGFSDAWMDTDNQKRITFTNLNPGKYTLDIRAISVDGEIITSQAINIQILPHWSRSTLAYFIYFFLLLGTIYVIVKTNNKRIRTKENLKYEQKRLEDAERQNDAKLQFYTNVSHELRTPLTLIMGELEMLLRSEMDTTRQWARGKLNSVFKNAKLLKELLNELLDFRKQEQGFMKLSVNKYDFHGFVQEIFFLFKGYADDKRISFSFIAGDEPMDLWFDTKLMSKVINNLLSNAFKFTEQGGKIAVVLRKDQQDLILSVADSGCGIPLEEQEKIFSLFYQIADVSHTEGKGIGLALTKAIVQAHHGAITVESNANEGAKFMIKLPLGNSHFEQSQLENNIVQEYHEYDLEKEQFLPEMNVEAHYKMLIVEDNLSLLKYLQELLSPYYHVTTATNGEEAWQRIEADLPDIIISDVLMPVMSGTELCKLVKENMITCHIPVVLLTAQADITHNIEGLRIGADEYMPKPFEPALLISKAHSLINNRVLLQEKFSKEPQVTPPMLATNNIDKRIMDRITDILEQNISNTEFSIESLAFEMNMSRTILFSKLKAITGQTPNDLISTFRLKRAAFLLRNHPEMNITEISTSVGFNSLRYFGKCFKEKYDQTPSVYRKQK